VTSVAAGTFYVLALAEDGLLYAWGGFDEVLLLGTPNVATELRPKPFEALQGVRVVSIAAGALRSYAVACTGEVWTWGLDVGFDFPLGHGDLRPIPVLGQEEEYPLPEPIQSLEGVKVIAVAAEAGCRRHTLALADDGSVYAWGDERAVSSGALGLGLSVSGEGQAVLTPQRIPALRVSCVL
jgi:alpha-tubulin suppressor-like RCC1 family protein